MDMEQIQLDPKHQDYNDIMTYSKYNTYMQIYDNSSNHTNASNHSIFKTPYRTAQKSLHLELGHVKY